MKQKNGFKLYRIDGYIISENHKFNFANGNISSTTTVYIKDISNYSLTYTGLEHEYTISTYMENEKLCFNVTGDINNSSEYLNNI